MEKVKKIGLFDFLHSINVSKTDLLEGNEKQYEPFMINRGLAQNIDTLLTADRLNQLHHLPKDLQYRYALADIPQKKRYGKWSKKPEVNPDIELICNYYEVNREVAQGYLRLLKPEDIEDIRERMSGGGRKK